MSYFEIDHLDRHLWFRYLSSGEIIAGGVLIPLTCGVFVALRLVARRLQKHAISVDDWLSVVALVHALAPSIIAHYILIEWTGLDNWHECMLYYWLLLSIPRLSMVHADISSGYALKLMGTPNPPGNGTFDEYNQFSKVRRFFSIIIMSTNMSRYYLLFVFLHLFPICLQSWALCSSINGSLLLTPVLFFLGSFGSILGL